MSSAASIATDTASVPVRVVIAMPHARLRDALSTALESTGAIAVVGQGADMSGAVEHTLAARPDVVLLSMSLVVGDVADRVQEITRGFDGVPVVLTGHEDNAAYVVAVIAAGAAAYVPLHGNTDELARMLQCAVSTRATPR